MKRIGISQRVETVGSHAERRDCLDQRWGDFLRELDCLLFPLPNVTPEQADRLLDVLDLDGVILSGGNSLARLAPGAGDVSVRRDAFEARLIDAAMTREIPLLGVCRGMQHLNLHFGGKLVAIEGHAGARHRLTALTKQHQLPDSVNSFHNWTIPGSGLARGFEALASDEQGNIEAFECRTDRLLGIMWHPEREAPFNRLDIELVGTFLA